jgi:NTE family protein
MAGREQAMAAAKRVNLALQGGGAHGAFTWGVLDFLLEDPRIEIGAISGTSAGAMNAVVLADGMAKGGRDGARAALAAFWQAVSRVGAWSPVRRAPIDVLLGRWSLDHSPAFAMIDILHRLASPYDFNPLDINPLRDLVAATVGTSRRSGRRARSSSSSRPPMSRPARCGSSTSTKSRSTR